MYLSVSPIVLRLPRRNSNEARARLSDLHSITFTVTNELSNSRYAPHFGSIHNILLKDVNMHETLTLTVLDHNEHRKDTILGVAGFELALLAEDATREGILAKILHEGKDCGELAFSL